MLSVKSSVAVIVILRLWKLCTKKKCDVKLKQVVSRRSKRLKEWGVCVCSRIRFKWTRGYDDTPTGRELGAVATLLGHHSAEFSFLKTQHSRPSSGPGPARTKNRIASRFVYVTNENTAAVTSICCLFKLFFFYDPQLFSYDTRTARQKSVQVHRKILLENKKKKKKKETKLALLTLTHSDICLK